jgi:hypothetical protein
MIGFSLRSLRLGEKSFLQSIYNPCNPVPDQSNIEIDQQAQSFIRQPEVGKKLFLVHRSDLRERLDFHDDLVLDQQVRAKPHLKQGPFVDKGYRLLPCETETSLLQLAPYDLFVNGFEEARTKTCVDSIGCIYDLFCEDILRHSPNSARQDAKIAKKE